jgi:hypothetical protein
MSAIKQDHAYNLQFDMLRSLAIIAVLIIHSINRNTGYGPVDSFFALVTLLVRPCIAVFLFLSGALFNINPVNQSKLKNKCLKVIVPYLIFSLFAVYLLYGTKLFSLTSKDIFQITFDILIGETFGIYYFVFIIVLMYIIGYFLVNNKRLYQNIIPILLFTLALNTLHTSYGFQLWSAITNNNNIISYSLYGNRSLFLWSCFFIAGIVYQKYNWQQYINKWRFELRLFWVSIFILYIVLFFSPLPKELIDGYHSPIGTIYGFSTVFLLLTFSANSSRWKYLSERSYFIYLIHIFFVYGLLGSIRLLKVAPDAWVSVTSVFFSLSMSIAMYWICYRVLPPSKRWILGLNR